MIHDEYFKRNRIALQIISSKYSKITSQVRIKTNLHMNELHIGDLQNGRRKHFNFSLHSLQLPSETNYTKSDTTLT